MKSHEVIAKALLEPGKTKLEDDKGDIWWFEASSSSWCTQDETRVYKRSLISLNREYRLYKKPVKLVKWHKYAIRVRGENKIQETCFYRSDLGVWSEWRRDQCKIIKILETIEAPERWEDCE